MIIEILLGGILICKIGEVILKLVDTAYILNDDEKDPPLSDEIRARMYS